MLITVTAGGIDRTARVGELVRRVGHADLECNITLLVFQLGKPFNILCCEAVMAVMAGNISLTNSCLLIY